MEWYIRIPVIENEQSDKYDAIFIENEYLKIMLLSEPGGRIEARMIKSAREI